MPKNQAVRDGKLAPTDQTGHCANCDASMWEYIYKLDILHVLLLTAMAAKARERMNDGLDFTVANQIHVQSLPISHATKCRTTQAAKLGLVVKMKGKGSKGIWSITRRGFEGLRGAPVPAMVKVFRNIVEEHFAETITFPEAKRVHLEAVEAAIARHKDPKRDHRIELESYRPEEWYQVACIHQGALC